MPDFKYWRTERAKNYLIAKDYAEAARRVISEMHRQVGSLQVDENGLARRGVLVRHLVMPDNIEDAREIMQFLAREISPDTYVNIMSQYRPAGKFSTEKYSEINRPVTIEEMQKTFALARGRPLPIRPSQGTFLITKRTTFVKIRQIKI